MKKNKQILVAGTMAFDEIITKNAKSGKVIGGAATYISYSSSFFTNDIYVSSIIGNDFPVSFLDEMNSKGIFTRMIEVSNKDKSFYWKGEYKNDFNTRVTHVTHLNVLEFYKPSINKGSINFDLVMLGNLDPVIQMDIYSQVKNDNNFVILDTMNYWIEKTQKELFEIICKVNLVVINDEESKMLGKSDSIEECAKNILSCGPDYIIIKKGSHGAELFSKHQRSAIPPLDNIKVVDPTGAGDSFVGGVCGYLALQPSISFKEIHNAMIHGAVIASFCIEEFGLARLQKISKENIDKRIKTFAKHLL
jgi:sugar/nucleoside kinase (ribokinase family)